MGSGVLPKTMLFRSVVMAQTTTPAPTPLHASTQEVAIHMIAAAARILLMLGTAILIGEVAAGPAKKLLEARASHRLSVNEDGEPAD
jgi:hypothetical protein